MSRKSPLALMRELIKDAEHRYGPREKYDVAEVVVGQKPQPETVPDEATKRLTIHVTEYGKVPAQDVYQLAHEAVHCLWPVARRDTLFFEEALAVSFALSRVLKIDAKYAIKCRQDLGLFKPAFDAFQKVHPKDEMIRALRQEQPCIDLVTPPLLVKHLGATDEMAAALCDRMPLTR